MANQQLSRASPAEGFSIARQVMEDVVARFQPNGGWAAARVQVEKVAEVLIKVYDDGKEAYDAVMDKIRRYEEAEREAKDREWQEMKTMMSAVLTVIPNKGQHKQPPHNKTADAVAETGEVKLPPRLSSPKAMAMWQRLQEAGMIDDRYQPLELSRTDIALLAEEMNWRLSDENEQLLGIMDWKSYEVLWHKNNMKADLQRANSQDKTAAFRNKLKELFDDIGLQH